MSFNDQHNVKVLPPNEKKQHMEGTVCIDKGKLIQMLHTLEGFKRQILNEIKKA